jgi:hypothetical protein
LRNKHQETHADVSAVNAYSFRRPGQNFPFVRKSLRDEKTSMVMGTNIALKIARCRQSAGRPSAISDLLPVIGER